MRLKQTDLASSFIDDNASDCNNQQQQYAILNPMDESLRASMDEDRVKQIVFSKMVLANKETKRQRINSQVSSEEQINVPLPINN